MRKGFESILQRARQEIDYAKVSLADLKNAEKEELLWKHWHDFLGHYKRAFGCLKRATDQGRSTQWSNNLKKEQASDPLLNYAFRARNEAEHRFEAPRGTEAPHVAIGNFIQISGDSTGNFSNFLLHDGDKFQWLDGQIQTKGGKVEKHTFDGEPFTQHAASLKLTEVVDRDKTVHPVPNPQTPEDQQATQIAECVLDWLEAKLTEAESLAERDRK